MTGSACWSKAFNGDWKPYGEVRGACDQYDIIYVNLSSNDHSTFLPQRIRADVGNRAVLVVGVDYSVALWKQHYNPGALVSALRVADLVICQEPAALGYLRALLGTSQSICLVGHPIDLLPMRAQAVPYEYRTGGVCAFIHRYDNEWQAPAIVCAEQPCRTYAVGWSAEPPLSGFFDIVKPPMAYSEYVKFAAQQLAMVDSYHGLPAEGRIQMENAALGVPTIGARSVRMQELLWPQLSTNDYDVGRQRRLLARVLSDAAFRDGVITNAQAAVAEFDLNASKTRLMNLIQERSR